MKSDWRIRLINTSHGKKYWVFDLNSFDEIGEFETMGEGKNALDEFKIRGKVIKEKS